jgi:hypothetical protein
MAMNRDEMVLVLERSFGYGQAMARAISSASLHEVGAQREAVAAVRSNWDAEYTNRKAVLAALSTPAPVAAPPADLVALVAKLQRGDIGIEQAMLNGDMLAADQHTKDYDEAHGALLDYPLPEVPK